ncbi:1,6-anhydro-N-acetylmuramyl-L-alanine amidase AmpD, partial [Pseudomonadales bacterium]|nr:1,6-anhydro-N-acetylmuramyl-L-alanine amidase AmpD [Pseudomonadales bacterium]
MEIIDGRLDVAEQHLSENCDERPNAQVDLIVIHCISLPAGHFGGDFIRELFCNQIDHARHTDFDSLRGMRVSSHLLIRRTGQI